MATLDAVPVHNRVDSFVGKDGQVPSHLRVEPGSQPIKAAELPVSSAGDDVDASQVATQWVESFQQALTNRDYKSVENLFLKESYWRDQLCLAWDFRKDFCLVIS